MNWANLASASRVVMVPVIILCYLSPLAYGQTIAAVLFVIGSITDWLDGYLARKLNLGSAFGAFLDPVADKLFVTAILVLLLSVYPDLLIPALLIVAREITISALREWMAERGVRDLVAVAWVGKLKTTLQMIALALLLGASPGTLPILFHLGLGLLWVAAFLGLWSLSSYLLAARATLQASDKGS
ncbi:CDP-diacylglycerol--glycerol-3-phosphate 3-phosphatidyltransferase [Gammaproteobacteria bacterium]|nr:CDP-diacylglycerol--glycerol-3-phosphate 3-phosphatidyltransferase [Gammaproteobacteria bacterium]